MSNFNFKEKTFITALLTAGGTWGFCYLAKLASGNALFTQSLFSLLFAAALFILLAKSMDTIKSRRELLFSGFFSWFLGITLILGYQIRMLHMTSGGLTGKLFIIWMGFLVGIVLWPASHFLFLSADKAALSKAPSDKMKTSHVFFISWGIIFLCWIPIFLAYYPAVMAYDFNMQSIQVVTGDYHTHHPLIHTGLLWIFFQLGKAVGSYQLGMAFFSLFQMLVLSCILGYSCTFVARISKKKWAVLAVILFYGLLPVNSVLSVSITKDVLFSGFFLLFLLLLTERTFMNHATPWSGQQLILFDAAFVLTGVLMLLFRNNAVYAFVPFAILYICYSQKKWLHTLLLCALILLLGKGIGFGLQYGLNADTGSISEMCSVPMQQFARVGCLHGNELSEEDYACIDWYVYDEYWQRYNPPIADTVKITVAHDGISHWEENLPKTFRDWMKIGLHYPNEYLDAFLYLTSGYWFLDDVSYAEVLGFDLEGRMGILYTFNASKSSVFDGIESHSLFPWLEKKMENIVTANSFFHWPVISLLFKPAFYCTLLFLCGLLFWYRRECAWHRKTKKELLILLPLLYLLTLLLGPVALMRYAYPFVIWSPVLLCMTFSRE